MLLLNIGIDTSDIYILVIKLLGGALLGLVGTIWSLGWFMYRGSLKRLDRIDFKLEPIDRLITLHDEQIKELKEADRQLSSRVNNHDSRIQTLEQKTVNVKVGG